MNSSQRLPHLPISIFAMVMGLAGFAVVSSKVEQLFAMPFPVSDLILWIASGLMLVFTLLYLTKSIAHWDQVKAEFNHPVKMSFFPTFSISLVLLSISFLEVASGVSFVLWAVGATIHFLFTLVIMNIWIHHPKFEINHINPAWFIPVVGNILIPVGAVHHLHIEFSWFFFSIGLLYWLVLLTIIFYRMIFHPPLPERLLPTFFIMIAPPAVGFIAYMQMTEQLDNFARILYYSGLFISLLLLIQIRRFAELKFFISWWAYSFPLAAMTLASLIMFEQTQLIGFLGITWTLYGVLGLLMIILVFRTLLAVTRNEVCVPEG